MTIVEVRRRSERMKELSPFGFRPTFRQRQHARLVVPQLRMKLVCEVIAGAADTLAERIAALNHEPVDNAMKNGAVVVGLAHFLIGARVTPLSGALRQPDKILDSFRRLLVKQPYGEIPFI